jgi:alpha-tubulin suppressor-like RCC1 family protein
MGTIHSPGNVYDPDHDTNGSPGGPFYITNLFATLQTNGTTTVSFAINGGTNGVFYDIFATSSLNNSLASNQWLWIGQGLTCNAYTFSNQPGGQAFYALELPAETFTVAFDGNNDYGQINVPYGLSNAIAVAAGGYFSLALRNNGTVIGWGDNTYGETNIPAGLSNVVSIAAGQLQGVALLANGAVTNWGWYGTNADSGYCSVTNTNLATLPPTSNVVAVAAGLAQGLALTSNGTVVAWGAIGGWGTHQTNLSGVKAIGCGAQFNLALLTNGTVVAWGNDLFGETNVPAGLSNVVAIATGDEYSLALRSNGTVVAWGYGNDGETNVPAGLSNVVAIAAGGGQCLALLGDGTVVAWGYETLTNIPEGMAGVKAISAGFDHNLAIESGIMDPVIFTQPTSQYALAHSNATFSAAGQGVAGVQYQWQFNGTNITGATNMTLTLTNVGATNNGNYDVVVSTDFGSITSSVATFTLVVAPIVTATAPTNAEITWINYAPTLSVVATPAGIPAYPLSYGWQFNGTNIAGASSASYTIPALTPTNEGTYTVGITNAAGSTNVSWNFILALPGMVETWGSDNSGECNRPATLTNAIAIAAGEYQSVAVTDSGTVAQWGQYWDGSNYYSVTNPSVATLPPTSSNLVAVAAGVGHVIGLTTNGGVVTWGLTNSAANYVPTNLPAAKAVGAGWAYNLALLTNGTVMAWGPDLFGQTNVPAGLSNVVAIAAGAEHSLALQSNGIVVAWGYNGSGQTNVPAGLSNVVAVAAGDEHSLALKSNGIVVAWGNNASGQTNVPLGLSNVMAVAAGGAHSVALLNTGNVVAWGDNTNGQTNVFGELPTSVFTTSGSPPSFQTNFYPAIVVKRIAAGGNHTMASLFSPLLQYPMIDVSKDLLLIYNATNTSFSSNVCAYYLAHRPMVSNANVLGISCATNEIIQLSDYTNTFSAPIVNWLLTNPTKRPQYVILFQDLPSRLLNGGPEVSVQYDMDAGFNKSFQTSNYFPSWMPFVTSINMNGTGGTNDCIAYINKLAGMATNNPPGTLFISASKGGYGNTNWYFDDSVYGYTNAGPPVGALGYEAKQGVLAADPSACVFYSYNTIITNGTNVAGYFSYGTHNQYFTAGYPTNGQIIFSGASDWYLIQTDESFNGQRVPQYPQGNFLGWYASNAFGGSGYSSTPVGAVCHVEEPGGADNNPYLYFGLWAQGKAFACCAWNSFYDYGSPELQVVGDPFVTK